MCPRGLRFIDRPPSRSRFGSRRRDERVSRRRRRSGHSPGSFEWVVTGVGVVGFARMAILAVSGGALLLTLSGGSRSKGDSYRLRDPRPRAHPNRLTLSRDGAPRSPLRLAVRARLRAGPQGGSIFDRRRGANFRPADTQPTPKRGARRGDLAPLSQPAPVGALKGRTVASGDSGRVMHAHTRPPTLRPTYGSGVTLAARPKATSCRQSLDLRRCER